MRIRRLHREEFEHAHAERENVRSHRWCRVLAVAEFRSVPPDGGHVREDDHCRFTDDVGEDLGQSEIGERDDSLWGWGERGKGRPTVIFPYFFGNQHVGLCKTFDDQPWTTNTDRRGDRKNLRISLEDGVVVS